MSFDDELKALQMKYDASIEQRVEATNLLREILAVDNDIDEALVLGKISRYLKGV